jgi:hypothetical protein
MAQESLPSRLTGHVVKVEAQPTPISLDLGLTAVLVIDMQNDFGAKGGMFDRVGIDLSMTKLQSRFSYSLFNRDINSRPRRKLCRLPACYFVSERNSVGRIRA